MIRPISNFFERVFQAIARLAPTRARAAWGHDARLAFRASCQAASARGGVPALLWTGFSECADLLWIVLRLRLHGRLPAVDVSDETVMLDARGPGGSRSVAALRDIRLAWRSLWAGGWATVMAMSMLALGIGVNATIFSVLDSVLWRPAPFHEPARLVELGNFHLARKFSYMGFARPLLLEWRRQTDLFQQLEGFEQASFVFASDHGAEMVAGATVTPGTFAMLGATATMGRTFLPEDGRGGTAWRAVVSDGFWKNRLGGVREPIGREIRLNGQLYRVIGVMPPKFRYPSGLDEVWVPFDVDQPAPEVAEPRTFTPVARLVNRLTIETATSEVQARGERVGRAAGGPPGVSAMLRSTGASVDERTERSLWVLSGAVAFLFLIVCANVANLALSRSLSRMRDLATCAALGASPANLVRTAAIEHGLLAICGAVGSIAVAVLTLQVVLAVLPQAIVTGTLNAIDLDARTLAFMLAAGTGAAMFFGLPPAFLAARTSVTSVLNRHARTNSGSRRASRLRAGLAIVEVAVSIVLLVGSAVMARSFVKLASVDAGFDTHNLISLRIGLPTQGYSTVSARDRAAVDLVARLEATPGVTAATVGGLPSETGLISFGPLEFDDRLGQPTEAIAIPIHEVPSTYFSVLRVPIRAGHTIRTGDPEGAVIVNERFATNFFGAANPLGRRFRISGAAWRTIVAVVGDTTAANDTGGRRYEFYYPIGGASDAFRPTRAASLIGDFRTFLIRADHAETLGPALADAFHGYDPSLVVWKTALVDDLLAEAIARPRVIFLMMSVFAAFGLVLATAGLYSVLSCLVAQRRREIGVRLALGASPRQIRRSILVSGLALTAAGVGIGLGAALPLVRVMRTLLFQVDPADPLAIATSAVLVSSTALFACWWPARDAMRIDPVDLLRGE